MSEDAPRSPPKPLGTNAVLLNLPHLVEKDPGLVITPEKPLLLKKAFPAEDENTAPKLPSGVLTPGNIKAPDLPKKDFEPERVEMIPTRLTALETDPTLDVTPEKLPAVPKKTQKEPVVNDPVRNARNLHVRFDVPDSSRESEESLGSDFVPLDSIHKKNFSPVTREKVLQEPFKKRAALYVYQNISTEPTSESSFQETSENTTASETLISTDSDGSFFNKIAQFINQNESKIADMSGRVIRGDSNVTQSLPAVKLKTVKKVEKSPQKAAVKPKKGKIINVHSETTQGQVKNTIDQITKPKRSQTPESTNEKKPFLKKKSGLHRHEHSVRYAPETPEDENPLCGPTYNSTLSLGQELQELKVSEFDAKGAVKKKMEESERLRNYIAEKTAEATNIDPEEKLYQNLVSVDVEEKNLVPTNSAKWKRKKPKPYKPKKSKYGEPDIWETYNPKELYYSDLWDDFQILVPDKPKVEPVPLEEIMWMDAQEQLMNGAWGWNL